MHSYQLVSLQPLPASLLLRSWLDGKNAFSFTSLSLSVPWSELGALSLYDALQVGSSQGLHIDTPQRSDAIVDLEEYWGKGSFTTRGVGPKKPRSEPVSSRYVLKSSH